MTEKYDPKTQALLFIEEMLFPEIQGEIDAIANTQSVPLESFMDYYTHHEKVSSFLSTKDMPQFDGIVLKQILNTYETICSAYIKQAELIRDKSEYSQEIAEKCKACDSKINELNTEILYISNKIDNLTAKLESMGISCPDVEGFRRMCNEYARYAVIRNVLKEEMRKKYAKQHLDYDRKKTELNANYDEFVDKLRNKNTYWQQEDIEARDKYTKTKNEKYEIYCDRSMRCNIILNWLREWGGANNAPDHLSRMSAFDDRFFYQVEYFQGVEHILNIRSSLYDAFVVLLEELRIKYPQWTNISFDDAWVDRDENIVVPLENQGWMNVSFLGFDEIYKKLRLEREAAKLNEEIRSIQRSREEYLAFVNQRILDDEKALVAQPI